jgi:inner membrane protein
MLIAHAPAGYLLTRLLSRTLFKDFVIPDRKNKKYQWLMAAGILGAIVPDFDFIYHLFIDSARTPHHSYLTHMPVFWLGMLLILTSVGIIRKNRMFIVLSTTFCLCAVLHLALDTVTGVIYWFYPLSALGINLCKVADVNRWWVHNFTHHWTFLFEIAIVTTAMIMFLRVKETIADIIHLYRWNTTLGLLTMRIGICTLGIAVIALVGSMKSSIDNRAVEKVIKLKHYVVHMFDS